MVQAKFYVSKIIKQASNGVVAELLPVTRGEENKEWSKWTPSGSITMSILNDAAAAWFEERLGSEVLIEFKDCEQPSV